MTGLVDVPYELPREIEANEDCNAWTWYGDKHAAHWAATPYRHNGEQVMLLLGANPGDRPCVTRSSVEATYGPLDEVPHCTNCGNYFSYRNGVCRTLACTQT